MTNLPTSIFHFLRSAAGKSITIVAALLLILPSCVIAQTAGEGAISGTVTDSTGAAIPNASITVTNTATGITATRTSSGTGTYNIAPLQPGTYRLQVTAKGFKTFQQENITVNALGTVGLNPVLAIGEATETVIVTAAPPVLNTTDATVGMVVENSTYSALPLQMSSQTQRDPTAFAALAPGAQSGTRLPIIGGTANYLGQLYLDGMPAETINQQGDNRLVSLALSVEAVDQFQVITSTPPAEYMGAGAANFTMKSGGLKYHGSAADFVRNTIFDAWCFTCKATTTTLPSGEKVPSPKSVEHENELSLSIGGKVPHTGNKLFFFVAYDKFHSRLGVNPTAYTIPSMLMRQGDFTELNAKQAGGGGLTGTGSDNPPFLFDPTSTTCSGGVCTRTPFMGKKNGIPTYNVIPQSSISPIAQKMQSFLPEPTNPSSLTGNWVGGWPKGWDNHLEDYRIDYDISPRQRISTVGAMGTQRYLNNYSNGMPLPYTQGTIAQIFPKVFDVEDAFTINSRMTNQFKYGFTRFPQPQVNATDGKSQYFPSAMGITNTPPGQASTEFPSSTFTSTGAKGVSNTTVAIQRFANSGGSYVTQQVTPSTYSLVDNFQWTKGKHTMTFGFTYQWEEINTAAPVGPTSELELPFTNYATADYNSGASTLSTSSGFSYASYLLGAVGGTPSVGLNNVTEVGGRYHVASPYAEDNWKVNPKLTVNLGIRWDYLPPFHEVKNRWSYLNPNLTNPLTGTPGMLQFAGNYGGNGVSCNCRTPVHTFWKNFGPRAGLNYAVNDKTVFRAGGALVFSQAGGVGGRGGNAGGTGQLGFNTSVIGTPESTSTANAAPSFYLNNSLDWKAKGLANTAFLPGASYTLGNADITAASQTLNTGNYLDPTTGKLVNAGGVNFADFYVSGRAPEFVFWNAGIERGITKDMTIAVNYVGDESHFLNTGSNARGYWANQMDPKYLAAFASVTDSTGKLPILIAPANNVNVARAKSVMAGINVPAFFIAAAEKNPTSSNLTLAKGLTAFPQYSCSSIYCGVSDTWGANVGNFSYHSLQITLMQRMSHGLSFNINYTYSKNIGDDGTFRSGFDIPGAAISGGGQNWHQDRIERSWTADATPQNLHAFGTWNLPFGKGHMGNDSWLVRNLAGGWQLSSIYTYHSGNPAPIVSSVCSGTTYPGQGQCMPSVVPGVYSARINGSYGTGPNGTTACNLQGFPCSQAISYIDTAKFQCPTNVSPFSAGKDCTQKPSQPIYLIGNAPRTKPYNLMEPGTQNLDAALHRTFPLKDFAKLVFEVDCINVWNKVTMNAPNETWTGSGGSFGTISGASGNPRDFQFAAHINF